MQIQNHWKGGKTSEFILGGLITLILKSHSNLTSKNKTKNQKQQNCSHIYSIDRKIFNKNIAKQFNSTFKVSVAQLNINNKLPGKKIMKTIPFIIALKPKYLGANFTNPGNDLYTDEYKILMKEIKEDMNKQTSYILLSLNIIKVSYIIFAIPLKISEAIFT